VVWYRPHNDRVGIDTGERERAMATEKQARGQTVVATFEGPLRSDTALTALKEAGFRPGQVAVQVAGGKGTGGGGAADGAGSRTTALVAGVVLGAIVGAILGATLGNGTLAIVLGALLGAVVGGAIAGAIARAGGGAAATGAATPRPGSVTLTVTADSTTQAQQARGILAQRGGDIRP